MKDTMEWLNALEIVTELAEGNLAPADVPGERRRQQLAIARVRKEAKALRALRIGT